MGHHSQFLLIEIASFSSDLDYTITKIWNTYPLYKIEGIKVNRYVGIFYSYPSYYIHFTRLIPLSSYPLFLHVILHTDSICKVVTHCTDKRLSTTNTFVYFNIS